MSQKQSIRVTEKKRRPKLARERVFKVASDLFYREGIRAVGVETIVKEAGVAKISLYRSFPSKDELIVAYLENRNTSYWSKVDKVLAGLDGNPTAQLRAFLSYVVDRTTAAGYRGCPFINFRAEFPDSAHAGHEVAKANKREMRARLCQIAEAMEARQPKQLADGLLLLIEGTYAISQTLGGGRGGPGHALIWAAEALVEAQSGRRKAVAN